MPFFPDMETSKSKTTPTAFDTNAAKLLLSTLRDKLRLSGRIRIDTWARTIRLMRHVDHISEKDITAVLNWLKDHLKDKYTPFVYNAKKFREKFVPLQQAMKRSGPLPEEISPAAISVVKRLDGLHWPKDAKARLSGAVQKTINNVDTLVRRLKLLTFVTESRLITNGATRLREHLMGREFVLNWWRQANARIVNWKEWGGDLDFFVFDADTKQVDALCGGIVTDYCGDPRRWEKIKQLLKDEIA